MTTIVEHALSSDLEVCGFVTIENGEFKTEPAKNIATYADNIFEIHPLEILKKIRSGKLVAIYHSHPKTGEDESKFDQFNCDNSCIPYLIYSKQTQQFNLVLPKVSHVKKEYVDMLKKRYD